MIFFDPNEPGWFSCSGTALDADTFLTAAHCTYGIGTDGDSVLDGAGDVVTSGGTDVWVTFADTDVLAGWPARADYPTEDALYEARSAWLDANQAYTLEEAMRMAKAFEKLGATPVGGSQTDFSDFIRTQVAHWGRVVKEAGIKLPQ